MKPGVYPGIPNAEYHNGPGVSKSGLDLVARSPMHYKAVRDSEASREPTPAQAIGTAIHALILEPEEFVKDFCLGLRRQDAPDAIDDREVLVEMVAKLNADRLPKLSTGGSKADQVARVLECELAPDLTAEQVAALKGAELKAILEKANESRQGLLSTSGSRHDLAKILRDNGQKVTLWSDVQAEWMENNGQRTVLSEEQWDQLMGMRDAVMRHKAASTFLTKLPGKAELSVYWNDPVTGVLCRCRPDWWREDDLIIDLKSTEDASPEGFAKSIANWRYDVQHPFYLDGIRQATGRTPKGFVFIAVEKKPPYAVGVYILDTESVELGRAKYREALRTFAECQRTNTWPGYGDKAQVISLPAWNFTRNQHLLDN